MPRGDDSNVGQKPDGTETQLQLDALDNLMVTLAGSAVITPVNVEELDGNPIDLNKGNAGAGTQRMVIADDDTNMSAIKTAVELLDEFGMVVQACNDHTAFTAYGDASNLSDDANHVSGPTGVLWDKAGGSNTSSGVEDTIDAVDLSTFGPNDFVTAVVYIPDLTDVASVALLLGVDNGNYNRWEWPDTVLMAGSWMVLTAPIYSGTILGNGWNQNAVTWLAIEVVFDNAADTLSGMLVDQIAAIPIKSLGVEMESGEVTARTQRVTMATDDTVATDLTDIKDVLDSGVSLPHAEFISPGDFSATYTSPTTLTLAGLSISMSNPQIAYVVQVLADNTSKRWIQGHNCTLKESGGVVTIYPNDASTPFVTADGYEVGLNYQKKGYDPTQDAYKSLEQNPLSEQWTDFEDYTTFAPDTVAYAEGGVIDARSMTDINFAWSKTASDADNNYIKIIYLDDSGSAVDYQEVSIGSPVGGVTPVHSNIYEVDKASGVNALQFPTKGFPFMRIDIAKATDTGTDATWVTKINKRWR